MILAINVVRVITTLGWFSLVILIFVILYRKYLRSVNKSTINNDDYVKINNFDGEFIQGMIQFQLVVPNKQVVRLRFFDRSNEENTSLICDQELKKGNHIFNFDTKTLVDGFYFYELLSDQQKITKLVQIKNN